MVELEVFKLTWYLIASVSGVPNLQAAVSGTVVLPVIDKALILWNFVSKIRLANAAFSDDASLAIHSHGVEADHPV